MFSDVWNDPVYYNTALLSIGGITLLAAMVIPLRNYHPYFNAIWASLKSWFFAAPILFLVIGLERPWPLVGVTVATIFCAKEFFQITGMYHRSMFVWIVYLGILIQALCVYYQWPGLYDQMPMIVLAAIMFVPLIRNSYKSMLQYMALSTFNFLFMGWGLLHMGRVLELPEGPKQIIFMVLLSEACDNVALSWSGLFGKIKILDKISHRRTLDGTFVSLIFTLCFAYLLKNMFAQENTNQWIIAGLSAFAASSLGDLILGVIRRDLGVKDVGLFIWGRGGILDLMDRMIFVAPIYYYAMKWMHEGYL